MLGRAGALTIESGAYATLLANSAMNEDGKALFHSGHNNLSATGSAITVNSLDAARVAMATQKDPSGHEFLDIRPSILLCPTAMGGDSRVVIGAEYDPDTSGKLQKPNKVRGLVADIIDSPRLEGDAWYLLASATDNPTVEVAFLKGQQEPYLEQHEGFTQDGFRMKARLDMGFAVVGWRGAYKNTGASGA